MRRFHLPVVTASDVWRAATCPGWLSLDLAREVSEAGAQGTAIHEDMLTDERCPPSIREWAQGVPEFEQSYRYDPDRHLALRVTSYADDIPEELGDLPYGGTLDVRATVPLPDGTMWLLVGDLKTGWLQRHGSLGHPFQVPQLRLYALMAAAELTVPVGRLSLALFKGDDRRYLEIEGGVLEGADVSRALNQWRGEFALTLRRDRRQFNVGEHCTYCNGLPFCPAYTGAVDRLGAGIATGAPLSEIQARLKIVEDLAKRAREWVRQQVMAAPTGEVGGLRWVPTTTYRLTAAGAAELARLAPEVVRTVSYKSVVAELGESRASDVWQSLRDRGLLVPVTGGQVHATKK